MRKPISICLQIILVSAPGVPVFAGAQVSSTKTRTAGEPAVIPYAVSTVRETKGLAFPFAEYGSGVGALTARNISLRTLMGYAYSVQEKRILGGLYGRTRSASISRLSPTKLTTLFPML
jgi:hypothetical protein